MGAEAGDGEQGGEGVGEEGEEGEEGGEQEEGEEGAGVEDVLRRVLPRQRVDDVLLLGFVQGRGG